MRALRSIESSNSGSHVNQHKSKNASMDQRQGIVGEV